MILHGLQSTTLLDYPGRLACTVFTGNCNFRCVYCQNTPLVLRPEEEPEVPEEQLFALLKKRRGILQGVCITGGEPTLQEDLEDFIRRIREYGYAVKLDTNGYRPDTVRKLLEAGLLDYVAMDIKTDRERYPAITQIKDLELSLIEETVRLLMDGDTDYEFRTTVVAEYYDETAAERIGRWLSGCRRYVLQSFRDQESVLCPGLHPRSREETEHYAEILRQTIGTVEIRGTD